MRLGLTMGVAMSVAAGFVVVAGSAGEAVGQEMVVMRSSGPTSTYKPISTRELEHYCRILGFEGGESDLAAVLLEGYQEVVRVAQADRRAAMERARAAFEESGDASVLMEGMRESGASFRSRTEELERAFFDDLKSLAMDVEESRWARVERARRRATEMGSGPVSTANVDLIALVEKLEGSWREGEDVRLVLEGYEMQLDGLLVERTRAGEGGEMSGGFDPSQFEAMAAATARQREVSLRIRALNDSVVAALGGLVREEEGRGALERAYLLAKFPRVYGESHASRLLAAAAGFEDLSDSQRAAIESLRVAHEARAASLNSRWAREIAESERKGEERGFVVAGGVRVIAGEDESAAAKASRARRELDRETAERLGSVLDEDQKSRLPARERTREESLEAGIRGVVTTILGEGG